MSANLQTTTAPRQLEAILPERCALRWHQALLCGVFVVMFLLFAYLPVSDSATWNMLSNGLNPSGQPELLPLADGVRHADLNWLSNRMSAVVYRWAGGEGVSFVYTMLQTAALVIWAAVFVRVSGRWWSAFATLAIVVAAFPWMAGWKPHTLGQIVLGLLALLLVGRIGNGKTEPQWSGARRRDWAAVVLLFAIWVNVDASVIVGVSWLACLPLSQALSMGRRHGWRSIVSDREFRHRVWLLETAIAATIINPRGWRLWESTLWLPDQPHWSAFGGYLPTSMATWSGICIFGFWAAWAWAWRRNGGGLFWVITPVAGTIAVAFCEAFLLWLAPLMVLSTIAQTRHFASVDGSAFRAAGSAQSTPLKFGYTLVAGLLVWMGFSFSPWSSTVLGGHQRSESQLIGSDMPIGLCEHLRDRPLRGLMSSPLHWSDWMQVRLHTPLMINSDITRVPESVVADHARIHRGATNWDRIAEKYALTAIVIDKKAQPELVRQVRRAPGSWKIAFEDSQALLMQIDR